MLQYLVIVLDNTSTSYCHYETGSPERRIIPLQTLKDGIRFGMKENLMIQFVYPDYELPEEYVPVIESIDHSKIKAYPQPLPKEGETSDADVSIANNWDNMPKTCEVPIVIRTCKADFFARYKEIVPLLSNAPRLNVAFTDVESFVDEDFETYKTILAELAKELERLYVEGKASQLNLLTDRMMLTQMNNCGAGDTTITLAPNGKFYVCPAFYYEDEKDCVGDLEHGLDIKNKQLYKLEYAPICRHCDAYHCKRCIWLNGRLTLDYNTPSHQQCVVSHLERNTSRLLQQKLHEAGIRWNPSHEIKEIDYLDPFNIVNKWK